MDSRSKILSLKETSTKPSCSRELGHAGQYARVAAGDFAIGPTSFTRADGVEVRAMDEAMMEDVIYWFAQAAKDAKEVGFDMIFLHFGHGWLVTEFLSPMFNKREDEYGGPIENRMKFPLRILKAIRDTVGPAFPIEMRVSATEWMPGGIEFEDVLTFIKAAQEYIDMVQISCGLDIEHKVRTLLLLK